MRNERESNCRGVASVVIDEYSRFVGEREREGERERGREGEGERERTINERRTLKKRSQGLYGIDRKIRRALGVYSWWLLIMLHAISNVKHVSLTGSWYTANIITRMGYRTYTKIHGSRGSMGWILGCKGKCW